ncbi:hypothetical protein, partial [Caballeronia sp. ATUFL_F2_KS9A]|uniref:hypothetical protein n=1 Tax=Caballeronia sp. ATUFL_F2_KS9A TaxID=2921777 RepID=UPI0020284E14
ASAPSLSSHASTPQIRNRGSSLRQTMLDPSAYTLTSNGGGSPNSSPNQRRGHSPGPSLSGAIMAADDRWHFKEEKLFP